MKSQMGSNFGRIGLLTLGVTCFLVQKKNIFNLVPSIAYLPSFYWNFMKLADNLDRHKIIDVFEFQEDQTFHFGVTCP